MKIDPHRSTPIYQQIVDSFSRDIQGGTLPAGDKLPTVRELAKSLGASHGTVKHAYDMLEQLGLIDKIQGSGCFVSDSAARAPGSRKGQAMAAIDGLLDTMQELGFTLSQTRIFFDLKAREREELEQTVRVAAVDCNPEALSVIRGQIAALPHADVDEYLLEDVMRKPGPFAPEADIIVTTPTHAHQLREKLPAGIEPVLVVVDVASSAIMELARIPPDSRVGILCASEQFGNIITAACGRYCVLNQPPKMALLKDSASAREVLRHSDWLILPPNHIQFCSKDVLVDIRGWEGASNLVVYQYQIERGSLLYLEEEVGRHYAASQL